MTNTLTIKDLRAAGACAYQVKLFEQHFGDGGTVTLAKVRKVASLFDWNWAARYLLSPAGRAEYERIVASAGYAEYDRVIASARAEYDRVITPAGRAEYICVIASAWFAGWKKDHEK